MLGAKSWQINAYKHTIDTAVDSMPIDEMSINIWFISSVYVAQMCFTLPSSRFNFKLKSYN